MCGGVVQPTHLGPDGTHHPRVVPLLLVPVLPLLDQERAEVP